MTAVTLPIRLLNGKVIAIEEAKAHRLVRKGRATYVTATKQPYENAMRTAR